MKILLIGPYPPPHGGISVHLIEARRHLERAGQQVRVLNTDRDAQASAEYLRFQTLPGLVIQLLQHSLRGWVFHVHTNGHNLKGWILALLCGLTGAMGRGRLLTIHSGMAPAYCRSAGRVTRLLIRAVCGLFRKIVAVNADIAEALIRLQVPRSKLSVIPAYLPTPSRASAPSSIETFLQTHAPIFSAVLFFRPEYGVEFLLTSLARLRSTRPRLGCLLLGSGDGTAEARRMLLDLGLGDSVLLLGDLSHDLCLSLISRSDVFLRCTSADGDSISVREAISLGTPVVATAVGCRPAGVLLFPPGDEESFIWQVEKALGARLAEPPAELSCNSVRSLMEVYRSLQPGKVRL